MHRGVHRGAHRDVHRGAHRDVCRVCIGSMGTFSQSDNRGACRSVHRHYNWLIVLELQMSTSVCPWLLLVALATIDLVDDNRGLEFKAYFKQLYPLWMVDSFRTSKVHRCLL